MPFVLRQEDDEQNPTLARLYGTGITIGRNYYYRKNAVGSRTGFITLLAQGARDENDDGNEGVFKVFYGGFELPEFAADGSRNWKHHRGRITRHPIHLEVTISAAADTLTTPEAHNYTLGDEVEVFARGTGTLPPELSAATTYYAVPQSPTVLKLATDAAGSNIVDLSTAGTGEVFVFATEGVGFNDPDQGALHFFPDLRWTGSGIDFIEVLLPTELSDGEDEPSRLKVIMHGKRVRSYTRSGVELVAGDFVYSTNNALIALDILTGDAQLKLSRFHAPSHIDGFVPRCDGLLAWEGGNAGTDDAVWAVRSNFDALDHSGLIKSSATAWDARAASVGFPAGSEIEIEIKAALGTFGVGFHTSQLPTTPDDMVFSLQPNALVNQITQKGSGVSNVMTTWQPGDTLVCKIARDSGGTLRFSATQNGNALPLVSIPAVPNVTLYVCVVGFHQASGISSAKLTPAGTVSSPRQVKRFDAQIHFADATPVPTALAAVMFRAPGCDIHDVNGRLKVLTTPNRTSVMTLCFDPSDPGAHTNILDFNVYRRSNHNKANFYIGTFRNSDDELLRRGAPVTVGRDRLQKKIGRPIVANAGNIGVSTYSLTRRILETQARLTSDLDAFYVVDATLESHKLAVGDFCYLAEKAVAYSNADPTLCMVLQELYIFSSPMKKRFLLQAINPDFYSDDSQGEITALIRSRTVSPFAPPPVVSSLILSSTADLQPDNSYLLSISGAVVFAPFNRQHAIVLWKRPSSSVFEATDILLTPVTPAFVITGVEAGVHTFRVITQTPSGVQSLSYIEDDVTATPPEVPAEAGVVIEDETTPPWTLTFVSQSAPPLTANRRLIFNIANADRTLQVAELEAFGALGNGPGFVKKTGDNAYALTFPAFSEVTGSLAASQLPAMTGGDVTSSAGSAVLSIGSGKVTFAKMATAAVSDDATLAGASSTKLVTERAAKLYADSLVVGLVDDRGNYNASGNVFPSSGGSGSAGAILKGDLWFISVAGTLGGVAVNIGDQLRALVDAPGQTASNWAISEANVGYVPENVANKATSFSVINNTLYPTTQAVQNWAGSTNLTTLGRVTTGDFGMHLLPDATDTRDIGSSSLLWRKGWLSELDAVLFAQNTISVVGGWMLIAKGEGTAEEDIDTSETQIDFGTNNIAANDFIIFRAAGAVEYMQATSLASGNVWNVTRNVDGSGANTWPQGSVYVNLGYNGTGRIELNASDTPRIQVLTQGTSYNSQTEMVRMGDLNGNWGYSSAIFGFAAGQYNVAGKAWITVDDTNGFRVGRQATTFVTLDSNGLAIVDGAIRLSGAGTYLGIGATAPTAFLGGTGIWEGMSSGAAKMHIGETTPVPAQPNEITGLKLWFKADALSLNNDDPVATWIDSSGNGWDASQGTSGNRPVFKTNILNGKPIVRFDGSDDFLARTQTITHGTVFVVMNYSGSSPFGDWKAAYTNDGSGGPAAIRGTSGATTLDNTSATMYVNGTASNQFSPLSSFKIVTKQFTPFSQTVFYIGVDPHQPTRYWNGDIAEIIVFDASLSATDRQKMETYLGDKYGISVANEVFGSTQVLTKGFSWDGSDLEIEATNFSLDAAGNLFLSGEVIATSGAFAGPFTLSGAGASFAIGTNPPTSPTAGTGGFMNRDALYGLSGGVQQAVFNFATGAITAGAGNVNIDASGCYIAASATKSNPRTYRFTGQIEDLPAAASDLGGMYSLFDAGGSSNTIFVEADEGSDLTTQSVIIRAKAATPNVILWTKNDAGADQAKMTASAHFAFTLGGIVVGTPTGGHKGTGSINAQAVYDDNTLLSDWLFDLHYDGAVRTADAFHRNYDWQRLFSLEESKRFTARERRLAWMPSREEFEEQRSLGSLLSRLWQGAEQQQLYIYELEHRIRMLESVGN